MLKLFRISCCSLRVGAFGSQASFLVVFLTALRPGSREYWCMVHSAYLFWSIFWMSFLDAGCKMSREGGVVVLHDMVREGILHVSFR